MGSNPIKVGVIGYGLSAKVFHIPFINLSPNLELYAVVQRTPQQGSSAPDDHPSIKHYTAVESLLADKEVQLVVVTTPPNTHYQLAKQVLESHKHVLVEKPLVPTSQEAASLVKIAKDNDRMICVYQNRRWDSDFLTVKQLIKEDKLGRIVEFETHFDRYRAEKPTTWKGQLGPAQGGGAIFDLGSHLLDQVYSLFGMPTSVFGKLINQRDGKFSVEESDGVNAMLYYESTAMVVHVRISVLSVEQRQPRYWIRGSKGSFLKHGLDPQEDQLRGGAKGTEANFGVEDPALAGQLSEIKDNGKVEVSTFPTVAPATYLEFYNLLAKALQDGIPDHIPVKAQEARDVLAIIEAIMQSAQNGHEIKF